MSVADQAAALQAIRNALATNIETMGVVVPAGATFADLPPLILLIEGGAGPILSSVFDDGEPVTVDGDPVFIFGSF